MCSEINHKKRGIIYIIYISRNKIHQTSSVSVFLYFLSTFFSESTKHLSKELGVPSGLYSLLLTCIKMELLHKINIVVLLICPTDKCKCLHNGKQHNEIKYYDFATDFHPSKTSLLSKTSSNW